MPGSLSSVRCCAVALAASMIAFASSASAACPVPHPDEFASVEARAPANVCTPADLTRYETAWGEASATNKSVEAAVAAQNPKCSACIFSHDTDPAWGPIVYLGGSDNVFTNFGACFERIAGGSATCGATVQKFSRCRDTVCAAGTSACSTDTDRTTCLQNVSKDPSSCGKYDYEAACPNYADLAPTCGRLRGVIEVLCSNPAATTTADAGGQMPGGSTGTDETAGSSSSSGSSGGGQSSGRSVTVTYEKDDSGCAQSGSSSGGSVATAMLVLAAVGAAVSRRRNQAQR